MEKEPLVKYGPNLETKEKLFKKSEIGTVKDIQENNSKIEFEKNNIMESKLTLTEEKLKRKKGAKIKFFKFDSNKGLYNGILNFNVKNIKNLNLPDSEKKENKTLGINFEKILSNIKIETPKNEEKGPTENNDKNWIGEVTV